MPSTFAEEWRDCLRAHYTAVVRNDDKGTERTLRGVMLEAGFSDEEIRQLYVLATAHVDAVGADFVPDMAVLAETAAEAAAAAPVQVAVALPQEAIVAELAEEALLHDELVDGGAEAEMEAEAEDQDAEPPPADPDVTQMSLF